ncbi:hypothetical protein [Reichenbachiella versicolor]|uniref:hypothetical protein n=1 Tax=Reichenbachiella versicolor TaxID=1821036 RepID=UPI000D6E4166|nr:hypothetical protein [Reichenbachiella versicolor]
MEDNDRYHELAKESGNTLKAYVLSVASGGTGVFFVALTSNDALKFTLLQKTSLLIALLSFLSTVIFCLIELRVDARRFYATAQELEKEESKQNWTKIKKYKSVRMKLINSSYVSLGLGILSVGVYLTSKILMY